MDITMSKLRKLSVNEWEQIVGTELCASMIKNAFRFTENNTTVSNIGAISEWCNENFNGLYYTKSGMSTYTIYIELEDDAMAFKLVWA